jgi:hypothetical protein
VIAGAGKKLGLYGFGAAAHIIAQVAKYQGRSVFAFTRPGDVRTQTFARGLGAAWAGGSDEMPPERAARRCDHLCRRGRSRAPGPAGDPQGRLRRLRGDPHERHPQLSLSACSGKSGNSRRLPI